MNPGELQDDQGKELMIGFCKLVNDKKVWHHAKMVVPQFGILMQEQ